MQRKSASFGPVSAVLSFGIVISTGCAGGNAQPAEAPAPASSDAAATTAPSTADDKPSSDADSANAAPKETASSAAAPTPAEPSLVDICEQGCKKIKAKCTAASYDNCHMNCAQYEHGPQGCEAEARVALECARDAEDVTCVNIAPELCAKKFQRVVACSNGKTIETKEEVGSKVPAGWERYSAKSAGFSALMPKGVSESTENGEQRWVVKEGEGTYTVRILPAPKEKPTQKNMVMVAMNALGKCNRNMKLFGMVERPEKVILRFDSKCPDGVDWRGAFVIVGSKMYMPFVAYPKAAKPKPEVDAYIYGFEVGK
jgi:hypothetical protein